MCFTILCGLGLFSQPTVLCFETNETLAVSQNMENLLKCENTTMVAHQRFKRFIVPSLSGWVFNFRVTLVEPLTTPLGGTIFSQLFILFVFTFKLDNIL